MAIKQLGLLLTLMSAPIASAMAISFTDPLDGQFDMGEYLAENAYGFLPVPILLTEPALGHVLLAPCDLQRVIARLVEPFDGGDRHALCLADRGQA